MPTDRPGQNPKKKLGIPTESLFAFWKNSASNAGSKEILGVQKKVLHVFLKYKKKSVWETADTQCQNSCRSLSAALLTFSK